MLSDVRVTDQEPTGLATVKQTLEAFGIYPLANLGQVQGQSFRPFLTEVTGLSVGRIAKGNLDKIRSGTIQKVQEAAKARAYKQGQRNGWSQDEVSAQIALLPLRRDGCPAAWASWVRGKEVPHSIHLPHTTALALGIDELIQSLLDACDIKDIDLFKRILLAHHESTVASFSSDAIALTVASSKLQLALDASDGWPDVGVSLLKYLENLLLEIYTGLDAEWGSQYFQAMKPVPIFLWVAPRINENWDVQSGTVPPKNTIYRPVRRLLELSYSLVHRHYRPSWPSAPAGRSELGIAMELADVSVGNYFDGTRKLSLDAYQSYWEAMCRYFSRGKSERIAPPGCPVPLGVLAITLQDTLVQTTSAKKLRSVVFLDEDDYRRRWLRHRLTWASLQSAGEVDWPAWQINQAVSSDSLRSSQCSGLSSSPRECQYSS